MLKMLMKHKLFPFGDLATIKYFERIDRDIKTLFRHILYVNKLGFKKYFYGVE